MDSSKHHAGFDAPELGAVIACEHTVRGWRGMTDEGEIIDVTVERKNGHPVQMPTSLRVSNKSGVVVGYYAVPEQVGQAGIIDRYQRHFDNALALLRKAKPVLALGEIDHALALCKTARATFNRALILLSLGRWTEGFAEYKTVEQRRVYMRKEVRQCVDAGLERWNGESVADKRLLLIHDHGFGDAIQCLRYVPTLKAMGADVALMLPPPLQRLAAQVAPTTATPVPANYFCSLLFLLQVLEQTPQNVPTAPYLCVYDELVAKWRIVLGEKKRKRIGVAWSVGNGHIGDYPREVPPGMLVEMLGDADLISVQQQGGGTPGIKSFPFDDFADCAALMSLMDEIVTVDTAAVHLAGAIGHPRITLLLSYWCSWRWLSPLYDNILVCKQDQPNDWKSAFAKRKVGADACSEKSFRDVEL